MKKIWTKALAYVLAATMCLSAVNVPVYAQGSMVTEVSTEAETMSEAVTEEVYEYTCNCHGDNSNDTITITNYGISKKSREAAIAKIPSNALPYCEITRYDGGLIGGWNFDNCQTPAYFMQILAAKMAGELTNKQFVVDINVADRYENAKLAIVKSAIGGLAHPHYTESYYILSNHITNGMFK